LIVRKSEEASGSGGCRNQFVLEVMPGQFSVVPTPNELQDSADLWNQQLTRRASMLDWRPEATELHETLLAETRITVKHTARTEEPYTFEINLLEEILALAAQSAGATDSGDAGFTFDGARPQKPPADIEPDVDADDSAGEAENGDAGSEEDAEDTGASGPVFDGQPPARGE
ncbi:MAG: hypothetical protein KGY42_07280, partial [Desulfobacterales bacterium]|nr:hypothetical protein [Desulfobacterales bacterium]